MRRQPANSSQKTLLIELCGQKLPFRLIMQSGTSLLDSVILRDTAQHIRTGGKICLRPAEGSAMGCPGTAGTSGCLPALLRSLPAKENWGYFHICLQNETSDLICHFSCIPGFSLSARIIVSAIINTHLICIKI